MAKKGIKCKVKGCKKYANHVVVGMFLCELHYNLGGKEIENAFNDIQKKGTK